MEAREHVMDAQITVEERMVVLQAREDALLASLLPNRKPERAHEVQIDAITAAEICVCNGIVNFVQPLEVQNARWKTVLDVLREIEQRRHDGWLQRSPAFKVYAYVWELARRRGKDMAKTSRMIFMGFTAFMLFVFYGPLAAVALALQVCWELLKRSFTRFPTYRKAVQYEWAGYGFKKEFEGQVLCVCLCVCVCFLDRYMCLFVRVFV
jgi:hypothetical protein